MANALALGVAEFDHGGNPASAIAVFDRQLERMAAGAGRAFSADLMERHF